MKASKFHFYQLLNLNMGFFSHRIKRIVTACKRSSRLIRSEIIFIFCISTQLNAAFEDLPGSAAHNAFAGAGAAYQYGPASGWINPALVNSVKGAAVGYYHPFGLQEITAADLAISQPIGKFTGAVLVNNFGNKIYTEQQFQLITAFQPGKQSALAISLTVANLSIRNYGQDWTAWLNCGFTFNVFPKLVWASVIKNTSYAKIGQTRENVPQIMQSGLCYALTTKLQLMLDLYKDSQFPCEIRSGVCLAIFENLHLRIGTANEPSRLAAGMSVRMGSFSLDYAYMNHADLPATHYFTAQFFLNGNADED